MEITTLCYIEKDEKYLMLHRVKSSMTSTRANGSVSEVMRKTGSRRRSVWSVK